ncbi:MAG: hypothetical protein KDD99_31670, partial [Bacteroidetes bacterium]|nr:hypothetical protein [Bacteroidota bacterium]
LHQFSLKNNQKKIAAFAKEVTQHIRNLPHFQRGEKVPTKWVKIRAKLEELGQTKNYISLETYREICAEFEIPDIDRQDFLSDFLHSLGVILRFRKVPLLSKMIILNPAWATRAVYQILDHTRKSAKIPGHFYRHELKAIWPDKSYTDVFEELLALMGSFELCYQLPHRLDEFIVPQLLPPDKPPVVWEDKKQLQLRYAYDFMPKGIVTRLIVRQHKYIENQQTVWKRGAVFCYNGAQAQVTELYRDRQIQIKAKGPHRKELLTIIVKEIDEINSNFDFDEERLRVNQMIPCNCGECQEAKTPYFFPKIDLKKARKKGVSDVQCRSSFEQVSVMGLMEEVFVQEVLIQEEKMYRAERGYLSESDEHFSRSGRKSNINTNRMTRKDYLRQLLMKNKLKMALEEMALIAEEGNLETEATSLLSQYHGLQQQIQKKTISFENRNLTANQILDGAQGLLKELEDVIPSKLRERVEYKVYEEEDPVLEIKPPKPEPEKKEQNFHFNGNVG